MSSSTVRIGGRAKKTLESLSRQTNRTMQDILDEAVELLRRQTLLAETNAAYAQLRLDPQAWADELRERAAWEAAVSDWGAE